MCTSCNQNNPSRTGYVRVLEAFDEVSGTHGTVDVVEHGVSMLITCLGNAWGDDAAVVASFTDHVGSVTRLYATPAGHCLLDEFEDTTQVALRATSLEDLGVLRASLTSPEQIVSTWTESL